MKSTMLTLSALFLALAAVCLVASCVSAPAAGQVIVKTECPEETRLAEVVVKTRDARGRMFTPQSSPFGNAAVVAKRWQFTDANGRHFYGETLHVHAPKTDATKTEIPKLTEPEAPLKTP